MPGPLIPQQPLPSSINPEGASVFDAPGQGLLRKIVGWMGLDDPNQIMSMGTAMDVGPMTGGLVDAVAQRFPRLTEAIANARGSLASSLKGVASGEYQMRAPIQRRMESLYQIGNAMGNQAKWAGNTEALMQAVQNDPELAQRFMRLIGATSPNTSVPVNTREALSVFAHSLENPGASVTVPEMQQLLPAKVTMAPSKTPNINNALAGRPLSGDKVEAFSQLMLGKPRIPIDVHALFAAGSEADKLQPELAGLRALMTKTEGLPLRGSLTDTDIYYRVEKAMASALNEIAPGVPTNESFATMWEGTRAAKGLKPQGGPIDILRAKGLLQPASMLDPERLRAALRTAGWTAPAIAAVMEEMDKPQALPNGGGNE
jgi:hypothetical protein